MSYKTELHCHTKDVSPCSGESAAEVANKYIENGYTSLAITNHASEGIFNDCISAQGWEAKVEHFYDAIDQVRRAAEGKLYVIDGMEIRFPENANDYLVFGMTKEFLLAHPDVFSMDRKSFHDLAKENGMIFLQAHPMRSWCELSPPDQVDGYEVFNGHMGHHSHNAKVEEWVKSLGDPELIMTSGTDSHQPFHTPDAGIVTEEPITTSDELLTVLKSHNYTLIKTPLGDAED